jgi:tRNA A37 methylthiotransferase MiaB
MPQIPRALTKVRAARLRAKGAAALAKRLAGLVGSEQTLLMEKAELGRTPCFVPVRFVGDAAPGEFKRVSVVSAARDHLTAVLAPLPGVERRVRRSTSAADFFRAAEGRPGKKRRHARPR